MEGAAEVIFQTTAAVIQSPKAKLLMVWKPIFASLLDLGPGNFIRVQFGDRGDPHLAMEAQSVKDLNLATRLETAVLLLGAKVEWIDVK